MALIPVPNPRAIGVTPDGMYMWRYHTRDVENDVLVCRYAVAHRCPTVSAPMTWFETEEAALMAHAMAPKTPPGFGLAQVKRQGASISYDVEDWP